MNLFKKSSSRSMFASLFFSTIVSDFVSESVIVEPIIVVTIFYKYKNQLCLCFYKTHTTSVPIFTNEILRCTNSNLALVGGMIGGLGGGPAGAAAGG